jgi:hypothetical protein
MFVLVTALAAWLGIEASAVHERKALRRYAEQCGTVFFTGASLEGSAAPKRPQETSWIRKAMGDQAIAKIVLNTNETQAEENRLASVFPEANIWRRAPMLKPLW